MARIALVGFGTRGDLYPLMGLGVRLRDEGHDAVVLEHDEYAGDVARSGLPYIPLGRGSLCDDVFRNADGSRDSQENRWRTQRLYYEAELRHAEATINRMLAAGPFDSIVSPQYQVAARIAAELLDARWIATTIGASAVERQYGPEGDRARATRASRAIDRVTLPAVAAVRRSFGLAEPADRVAFGGFPEAATLVLTSRALVRSTAHWPANVHLAGYPAYFSDGGPGDLSGVRPFLKAEHLGPLVVCSVGDGWAQSLPDGLTALAADAEEHGYRLLYVLGRARADISGARCLVTPTLPLPVALERACVSVNHAGIGTLIACLQAGVPSVTCPLWPDGFDNAKTVAELGLGVNIGPGASCAQVADALHRVIADARYRARVGRAREVLTADPDPAHVLQRLLAADGTVSE